jgi:dynein heavy chain
MGVAANYINSNLFIFNVPLRNALMSVRSMTISLSNMGMLSLPKTQTFDLDDFVRVQALVHDELRENLRKLSSEVLSTVRAACDEVVDQFLKSNNIAANHKMTFMERAALRAECKRLTRFLRMMDILISDFLKTMVNEALIQLVAAVESDNLEPRVETFDHVTLAVMAKKREEKGWKTPLFRIIAAFKKVAHKMRHHHHQQQQQRTESMENSTIDDDTTADPETPNHEIKPLTADNAIEDDEVITLAPSVDYLVHAIDGVIRDALEIVGSFVKVLTAPETEMYVMPEGDEEEGEAAEVVDIISSIKSSPQYIFSKETIHNHLRNAFSAVKEYLAIFQPYRQLFLKNAENVKDISVLFESGDVESFQNAIAEYRSQLAQFSGVPRYSDVGVVLVDSVETKSSMIPSPTQCLLAIQNYLPELAKLKAQELVDEVGAMNPILSTDPASVEAYVNKKKMKDLASAGMGMYNDRQSYIRTLVHIMDDNQWPLPDTVKALMRMLKESLLLLESNIQLAEGKEEDETKKFSLQVTEECPKVLKRLSEIRQQLDNSMISEVDAADDKVVKFLAQQEADFQKLKSRCEKLQEYQGILKMTVDEFEMLEEIQSDLNLKIRLWTDRGDWNKLRQGN